MILFIILFSLLGVVEVLFKPRMEFIEESSVLVFYYFAAKNIRKRVVFKI